MNEKEIEKIEARFYDLIPADAYTDELDQAWDYMAEQLKEAYYQGYMAGTMEAL